MSKKMLLSGILGPLIYVITIIIGGLVVPDYNHLINTVSDLQKENLTGGGLLSLLFIFSAIFLLIFALNIIRLYGKRKKVLLIGGGFFIVHAICAILLATVFRMSSIDSIMPDANDPRSIVAPITALVTITMIVLIGVGFNKYNNKWNNFLLYSVITVLLTLILGISQSILVSNEVNLIGLFERLTHTAYLQWIVVLSVKTYRLEG